MCDFKEIFENFEFHNELLKSKIEKVIMCKNLLTLDLGNFKAESKSVKK